MSTVCLYFIHMFLYTVYNSLRMSRDSSVTRAAIHDKVRGSLSSLQESLFAGKDVPVAAPGAVASVNPAAGVDDDLAARIARIRNVNKK